MSSTNYTKNLKLPQFVASDKPSWLGDVNGAMLAIDNGYASQTANITTATDAANSAKSQSDANAVALTNVNTEIDSLDDRVTALEAGGGTEDLQKQLNETDAKVVQNTTDIATNTTEIEALQTLTDSMQDDISTNTENIETNKTSINTVNTQIGALQTSVSETKTIANQAQTTANSAQTASQTNATSITTLNSTVTDLQSAVNTNTSSINTINNTTIPNLQSQIANVAPITLRTNGAHIVVDSNQYATTFPAIISNTSGTAYNYVLSGLMTIALSSGQSFDVRLYHDANTNLNLSESSRLLFYFNNAGNFYILSFSYSDLTISDASLYKTLTVTWPVAKVSPDAGAPILVWVESITISKITTA